MADIDCIAAGAELDGFLISQAGRGTSAGTQLPTETPRIRFNPLTPFPSLRSLPEFFFTCNQFLCCFFLLLLLSLYRLSHSLLRLFVESARVSILKSKQFGGIEVSRGFFKRVFGDTTRGFAL